MNKGLGMHGRRRHRERPAPGMQQDRREQGAPSGRTSLPFLHPLTRLPGLPLAHKAGWRLHPPCRRCLLKSARWCKRRQQYPAGGSCTSKSPRSSSSRPATRRKVRAAAGDPCPQPCLPLCLSWARPLHSPYPPQPACSMRPAAAARHAHAEDELNRVCVCVALRCAA